MAPPPPSSSQQVATAAESANRPVEQRQRENTKMRKPSFWSIFRGSSGSQRKDSDEKVSSSSTAFVGCEVAKWFDLAEQTNELNKRVSLSFANFFTRFVVCRGIFSTDI